jgi:hypothetical protein
MLIPWERFSHLLGLSERLRAAVVLPRHGDATPGGDLILEFGLASLASDEYLQDLKLGPHPLAGDQVVQDAWDIEFRHYTTLSRFLYEMDEAVVERVQAELDAIIISGRVQPLAGQRPALGRSDVQSTGDCVVEPAPPEEKAGTEYDCWHRLPKKRFFR